MEVGIAHIVPDVTAINYGIWNAALFADNYLKNSRGVKSLLIVCQEPSRPSTVRGDVIWVGRAPWPTDVVSELIEWGMMPEKTIVVSHGCWLAPTRLAYQLKKKGFRWIYTPHGMLEPWSRNHKWFKKKIYFSLFEKKWSVHADSLRAVSKEEQKNLQMMYKRPVWVVENGTETQKYRPKSVGNENWLFMARLHHKKGVLPLVKAWTVSMKDTKNKKLIIAGPDDGELEKIKTYIDGKNIEYLGPIYGDAKVDILNEAHYYILPSFSEGFPTSVVEAMSYGVIPLISSGCNFPEVFENKLGHRVEPDGDSLASQLAALKDRSFDHELSKRNCSFVGKEYSEPVIGEKLYAMYCSILGASADKLK
jgi:glycosyltransferase involved in cell wall biosynthesis